MNASIQNRQSTCGPFSVTVDGMTIEDDELLMRGVKIDPESSFLLIENGVEREITYQELWNLKREDFADDLNSTDLLIMKVGFVLGKGYTNRRNNWRVKPVEGKLKFSLLDK